MAQSSSVQTLFRVIDTLDHPHGGRILRLRLQEGDAPTLKELKGATMQAKGPEGGEASVVIRGFAVFGGKQSDARLARTGRVDVHIEPSEDGDDVSDIGLRWELSGPE